jgi:hypothetical protein
MHWISRLLTRFAAIQAPTPAPTPDTTQANVAPAAPQPVQVTVMPAPTSAPQAHALGQPTYPQPTPYHTWMGAYLPSGQWAEAWVYTGNQHAQGIGIQPGESSMQYAQRMGVPDSVLATMNSAEAVDNYLKGKVGSATYDAVWAAAHAGSDQFKVPVISAPPTQVAPPQVTDEGHMKAVQIEAALFQATGGSIYRSSVGTPSELNTVLGQFNPAAQILNALKTGNSVDTIASVFLGQRGFEGYTVEDIKLIASRI